MPADTALVTWPTYLGALQAFNAYEPQYEQLTAGGNVTPEAYRVAAAKAGGKPKFAYLVPDFSNPSGETLSRGERDNVVGVLYAKDLLGRDVSAAGFRLEPFLRPPAFVPLGMRAGDVFGELRRRKVHLALVVDEYGGIAGLVTMEDLLEELFGEIRDEYDEAEAT